MTVAVSRIDSSSACTLLSSSIALRAVMSDLLDMLVTDLSPRFSHCAFEPERLLSVSPVLDLIRQWNLLLDV